MSSVAMTTLSVSMTKKTASGTPRCDTCDCLYSVAMTRLSVSMTKKTASGTPRCDHGIAIFHVIFLRTMYLNNTILIRWRHWCEKKITKSIDKISRHGPAKPFVWCIFSFTSARRVIRLQVESLSSGLTKH